MWLEFIRRYLQFSNVCKWNVQAANRIKGNKIEYIFGIFEDVLMSSYLIRLKENAKETKLDEKLKLPCYFCLHTSTLKTNYTRIIFLFAYSSLLRKLNVYIAHSQVLLLSYFDEDKAISKVNLMNTASCSTQISWEFLSANTQMMSTQFLKSCLKNHELSSVFSFCIRRNRNILMFVRECLRNILKYSHKSSEVVWKYYEQEFLLPSIFIFEDFSFWKNENMNLKYSLHEAILNRFKMKKMSWHFKINL